MDVVKWQEVKNITVNGKYAIRLEKAPSAGKQDGFKVEVNSDDLAEAQSQAKTLYEWACDQVKPPIAPPSVKPVVEEKAVKA